MTGNPEIRLSSPRPIGKVFVSYSHADEPWKDAVVRHLGVLQAQDKLTLWDDRQLAAGDDWLRAIETALDSATIGLLLVSANSLTSDFILRSEVPELLRRRASQGLHLIPVILRPCAWREVEWLAAIQAFPRDGVPLSTLAEAEVDSALALLARDVHRLASAAQGTAGSGRPSPVPPPDVAREAPAVVAQSATDPLAGYRVVKEIQRGHYGRVLKCTRTSDAQTCVVKQTDRMHVWPPALEVIAQAGAPNVVSGRRIWSHGEYTYEELPYVAGVPLWAMIAPARGGLEGSVLESFHRQVDSSLARLHRANVIHRDIHPANVYAVIERPATGSDPFGAARNDGPWMFDYFEEFLLAWVIVDCTFATLTTEPSPGRYRHGSYSSEEQELGAPSPASDMYSLGTTLFYGITGQEPPPAHRRRLDPEATVTVPGVGHSYWEFPRYVESLLSMDPARRPKAGAAFTESTVVPGYCSTLRLGQNAFLISDMFPTETRILDGPACLAFHREYLVRDGGRGIEGSDHDYWVHELASFDGM